MTKSRGINAPRRAWSDFELEVLRAHYPTTLNSDLAELFGRGMSSIGHMANKLDLHKSTEWIAKVARERIESDPNHGSRRSRIQKGNVPSNKGKKMPAGWAPGEMARTQFKLGSKPVTWRPVGTYVINGEGYLDMKVADGTGPRHHFWKPVHRLVWLKANGEIPPGQIVVFKPGQFTNVLEEITLDRIECITRRELMLRNTFHNLPPKLREIVQLRGAITRQINKRLKESP